MTGTWAATDGTRYGLDRSGAGMPVLLLHGFTGSGADWEPFRTALDRLTSPIAVDLLGHGASDAPSVAARHALARQAADLAELLRALDAAPAHVVGYSLGARVALRLALDHHEAVLSLALEGPSAGIADGAERERRRAADEALAELLERDGIEAFVDRWEAQPLFDPERELPAVVRDAIRRRRLANDPLGLAASLRGAGQGASDPLHDALTRIAVPVTVIAGALDQPGLPRAESVAHAIVGARLVTIPSVGHAPHREAPSRFARELAAHLVLASDTCAAEHCSALHPAAATRSRP